MASRRADEPLDLSIVIPAFNEEARLPAAIAAVAGYLEANGCRGEVVIVENGSTDQTAEIARAAARADPRFRALHVDARGKGRAVRMGMLASRGGTVVFCDADFSMSIEDLAVLKGALADGADVAIASREASGAHRLGEPLARHLMGRVYNWLVQIVAVPGVRDTQCGFKAFRRPAAEHLFRRQTIDGWAFDVEVLFLARRGHFRVKEVPVTWRYDPSSRVRPLHDTIAMLRELLTVRWNALCGRYG
ncbi:MAG: glycosyltransferase [Chloroflexi bacterium]|nr:glycosyltransferase [Chloroflexota bacterium]